MLSRLFLLLQSEKNDTLQRIINHRYKIQLRLIRIADLFKNFKTHLPQGNLGILANPFEGHVRNYWYLLVS